jgi:hypothetical protein
MPGEYEKHLNHLLKLVQHEGWRDYALAQAQKLSKHPSGLYAGLEGELLARMQQQKEAKNES